MALPIEILNVKTSFWMIKETSKFWTLASALWVQDKISRKRVWVLLATILLKSTINSLTTLSNLTCSLVVSFCSYWWGANIHSNWLIELTPFINNSFNQTKRRIFGSTLEWRMSQTNLNNYSPAWLLSMNKFVWHLMRF
jgi:hypothetical protein